MRFCPRSRECVPGMVRDTHLLPLCFVGFDFQTRCYGNCRWELLSINSFGGYYHCPHDSDLADGTPYGGHGVGLPALVVPVVFSHGACLPGGGSPWLFFWAYWFFNYVSIVKNSQVKQQTVQVYNYFRAIQWVGMLISLLEYSSYSYVNAFKSLLVILRILTASMLITTSWNHRCHLISIVIVIDISSLLVSSWHETYGNSTDIFSDFL